EALRRDLGRREAEVDGLREGDVAGERDVPAAVERGREHVRRREAVEYDRGRVVGEPGERVVVGRARVDHYGLAELGGELEPGGEEATLVVARRVVAEPVEPRLAHRNGLRMREQLSQGSEVALGRGPRVVRVDAEDREHPVVPLRELERAAAVLDARADGQDSRDAGLDRTPDRLVGVVER